MRGPNSWLEPDLFYVAAETQTLLDPKYPMYMTTADLVIMRSEVLSGFVVSVGAVFGD